MEILQTALYHALIGMGITFSLLILLIICISLFRFIPHIQSLFSKGEQKEKTDVKAETAEPVESDTSVDMTDDLELVAVITAAVAAVMGTTDTNGFVVRSIRRKSANHWKR